MEEEMKKEIESILNENDIFNLKIEQMKVEYSDYYYDLLYIRGYKNGEEYLVLTIWLHSLIQNFEELEEKEQEKIKVEIMDIIDNLLEQNGYKFSLYTYSYQKTST
jgi:hypothetical protein